MTGCKFCTELDGSKCATCDEANGYYINSVDKQCYYHCGDGIIVPSDESCDDNNTATLDGCDDNCNVESYFTCTGSPSVCKFASSATASYISAVMESDVCNTVTFRFGISPVAGAFGRSDIVWDNFLIPSDPSLLTINTSLTSYLNGQINLSYYLEKTL